MRRAPAVAQNRSRQAPSGAALVLEIGCNWKKGAGAARAAGSGLRETKIPQDRAAVFGLSWICGRDIVTVKPRPIRLFAHRAAHSARRCHETGQAAGKRPARGYLVFAARPRKCENLSPRCGRQRQQTKRSPRRRQRKGRERSYDSLAYARASFEQAASRIRSGFVTTLK